MTNDKCGCEDESEKVKENIKENNECDCGCDNESSNESQNAPETGDCGCGEESIKAHEEDSRCGCGEETSKTPEDDTGCGCGEENNEAQEQVGCCGTVDLPDLSRVENPINPKFMADEDFIKELEDYAHSLGISNVGYTLLTSEVLIKDKFVQYPFTIVLTMEMDNEIIKTAPGTDAKDLNDTAYVKSSILTTKLSDYIRKEGYSTEIANPMGGIVNFSLLGQKARLGHIGASGLLITPELGPRLKVSAIFVSIANLPVQEVDEYEWIPEYCEKCGKCVKACPEKALVEKDACCTKEIQIIPKKCVGCSQGCTYCIEACPFEEKGYEHVKNKFDKMNAKLKEKQAKNFDVKLWDNWVKQNKALFEDIVNGFSIAIAMTENENLIFLDRADNELNVSIKPINELENSNADLLFVMDEKCLGELLNDPSPAKFGQLLASKNIDMYGLNDPLQLKDKGYVEFLKSLGLNLGSGDCCG